MDSDDNMAVPAVKKVFRVIHNGRDEYPGDGLRLADPSKPPSPQYNMFDKDFIRAMGVEVQLDDEVEVAVRVVSRVYVERRRA